jgi:hypothetical protein
MVFIGSRSSPLIQAGQPGRRKGRTAVMPAGPLRANAAWPRKELVDQGEKSRYFVASPLLLLSSSFIN